MNKLIIPFIMLVVIVAGAGAYYMYNAKYPQKNEVKLPSERTTTVPKEKNTITIKDFSFDPNTLTVKVGEAVTWFNEDGVVHTIKSTDFNSPNIKNADTFQFQFTKPGMYEYTCGIHPSMKGKVVVE